MNSIETPCTTFSKQWSCRRPNKKYSQLGVGTHLALACRSPRGRWEMLAPPTPPPAVSAVSTPRTVHGIAADDTSEWSCPSPTAERQHRLQQVCFRSGCRWAWQSTTWWWWWDVFPDYFVKNTYFCFVKRITRTFFLIFFINSSESFCNIAATWLQLIPYIMFWNRTPYLR